VADEHAVDEPPHEHETQTALSGTMWGRRRLPPTAPVADLHAESVGLGPKGQFDDARLIRVVGVLDGVRRCFTHRQEDLLSAVLRHRERGEAAHHLMAQGLQMFGRRRQREMHVLGLIRGGVRHRVSSVSEPGQPAITRSGYVGNPTCP
jgi:hypothetical protein